MKLRNKIALAVSATLLNGAVSAAQLHYRPEWKDKSTIKQTVLS